jgi:hypothetical protein
MCDWLLLPLPPSPPLSRYPKATGATTFYLHLAFHHALDVGTATLWLQAKQLLAIPARQRKRDCNLLSILMISSFVFFPCLNTRGVYSVIFSSVLLYVVCIKFKTIMGIGNKVLDCYSKHNLKDVNVIVPVFYHGFLLYLHRASEKLRSYTITRK